MTDNASNFGKCLRTFSIDSSVQSTSEVGDLNKNSSDSDDSDFVNLIGLFQHGIWD